MKHLGALQSHFAERSSDFTSTASWVHHPAIVQALGDMIGHSAQPRLFLDLASGTCVLPRHFQMAGISGRWISLDASIEMLQRRVSEDVMPVAADAHAIPIASGVLDGVLCRQGFHYFEKPILVFSEIRRVLKEAGRLFLAQTTPFPARADVEWWKTLVRIRQPLRQHRWTAEALGFALERSGFQVERELHLYTDDSLRSWTERYPASASTRRAVMAHYRSASPEVAFLRDFKWNDDDVTFKVHWSIFCAQPATSERKS